MKLKDRIKNKICLVKITPNYPLGDFVSWADTEKIDIPLLSVLLQEIQLELDSEAKTPSHFQPPFSEQHPALKGYWCLYCSQIPRLLQRHYS